MNTNEVHNCFNILTERIVDYSNGQITTIPTYDVLRIRSILQQIINKSNIEDDQPCLDVIAIEEVNKNAFEFAIDGYLQKDYEIIASSCNSKTWKAIMKRKDKENDE